ncbi:DUF6639 family protein [Yoonia sediminilitoris]|uniref:Uncharacterized protein n=1 Tax=Yoonia sediminilitoris TaxID=1286148 RepID=A0A2T6K910_9RHOB|nr:DUF6639 family protein [Yoonia sediminilitoris]PUB11258.1 hypothetical protein C8N45_11430 [Yoonia sediminilitoris]RCW91074.1 hypothetical protein DFP92_11430 [Yoonia sediminilitoris]
MQLKIWLVTGFTLVALTAQAEGLQCPDLAVTVTSGDPGLSARVCEMVATSSAALAACNMPVPLPLSVTIKDRLAPACLGLYHCGEARIDLLKPAALPDALAADSVFRNIAPSVLFSSIIMHELTHASYEDAICPFPDCPTTAEYLAYAMQIRSLPPSDRATVLAMSESWGRISRDEINLVYMSLAPDRFALKSYLHLSQRDDPCAYVGQIMRGDIVLDRERP